MARFNKIYAGPVTEVTPQVQERICAAAILPGTALVESGASFAQAGANSGEKLYIAQDNYLALKGTDDACPPATPSSAWRRWTSSSSTSASPPPSTSLAAPS